MVTLLCRRTPALAPPVSWYLQSDLRVKGFLDGAGRSILVTKTFHLSQDSHVSPRARRRGPELTDVQKDEEGGRLRYPDLESTRGKSRAVRWGEGERGSVSLGS